MDFLGGLIVAIIVIGGLVAAVILYRQRKAKRAGSGLGTGSSEGPPTVLK